MAENKESKETKQEVENTSDLDADKDGTQAPGDEDVKNDNSDSAPGASDVDQESGDETDSGSSSVSWEYTLDPNCENYSQSQACHTKGGKSYTPEGWIRKYKKRRSSTKKPVASKKLKLED